MFWPTWKPKGHHGSGGLCRWHPALRRCYRRSAAKVNDIIAIVGKEGEDIKSYSMPPPAQLQLQLLHPHLPPLPRLLQQPAPAAGPTITPEQLGVTVIRMPLLSDTMTEGKIVKWNKKVGDKVKADDNLADVETDKATMEVVGYAEGTLLYIGVKEGEAAKVNGMIAIVGKEGTDVSGLLASLNQAAAAPATAATNTNTAQAPTTAAPAVAATTAPAPASANGRVKASPLAKKLAEEKGIDIKRLLDPAMVEGS